MTEDRAAPIHLDLDDRFYRHVEAAPFPQHILRWRNDRAAATVGLDALDDTAWVDHFGRFAPLPGNIGAPLALCYHGHQFGHYNHELGDGRGFLFAQLRADDGRILDLGTKGSGQTPFARTADGRLTLKGAVREIMATELLEALGVNTSKTFSVIETGESLQRHDEPSPTRAAVMVRLSHGHIRIGSFQRCRYLEDVEGIEMLMRHTARHHFAAELDADAPVNELAPAFLATVAARVAATAGSWMAAGFVHGVLNTDNFNVTGESFDYGPWRFLPRFDPSFTAAYFDNGG
ncbi:MAG: protein adenylyltransferase SelO family protein, partial [Pseudomonadota bacterium]|nr:protein adenylyltransferase SelO family protein [Pseudomonadota bacterium]